MKHHFTVLSAFVIIFKLLSRYSVCLSLAVIDIINNLSIMSLVALFNYIDLLIYYHIDLFLLVFTFDFFSFFEGGK